MKNDPQLKAITAAVLSCVPSVVGIYLHGSACLGGFVPGKSDLDLLVFSGSETTREERVRFGDALAALHEGPAPIELSVVRMEDAGRFPVVCQFHFSEMYAARYAAHNPTNPLLAEPFPDPDIPPYYRVARESGIALFGPPPGEIVPEVADRQFWEAVTEGIDDFSFGDYGLFDSNILTLARILSFARTRKVLTKVRGAEWGIGEFPRFAGLLRTAVAAYRDGIPPRYDPIQLEEYRAFMIREILAERVE